MTNVCLNTDEAELYNHLRSLRAAMRLKRLRKAGDITYDQSSEVQTDAGTATATATAVSSKTQASTTMSGRNSRTLQQEFLFVISQVEEKATSVQPDLLQSVELHQKTLAIQADTGAPSEDEEDFEERQDDRANDPACIQCDDGGALLSIVWLASCVISVRQML